MLLWVGQVLAQPAAKRGVIDLHDFDFENSKAINLDGEWEFYWEKLITPTGFKYDTTLQPIYTSLLSDWGGVPELQNSWHQFGYATYRLRIICAEDIPSLSLYIPEFYTAYAMYVNENGFEGNGTVGTSKLTSIPKWRPTSKVAELKPGINQIIVQVSNFHHHRGGAIKPMMIGNSDVINKKRNFEIGSALFLAGCLLIAGALAFGLFWFNRTDYSGIFFGLFAFIYAYRILGTDQYVVHAAMRFMPWHITLRMEYISLFLSVIFYSYFVKNLISLKVKPIVFHIIAGVSAFYGIGSLILPTAVFTAFFDYYLTFLALIFGYVSMAYLINMNLSHKMTYVTLFGALAAVMFNKILDSFGLITQNPYLNVLGYVAFLFSQAVALAIRFGRNFRDSYARAQIASRSKTDFLNTMSHELRTPMNAILGMTDFLERTKLDAGQREKLQVIKKNGESLLSIIMDILSLSELGSGELKLEKKALDLRESIEGAVNLAARERRNKPIELKLYIDPEIPERLVGDSIRIKQVFMHLLGNAYKFTEQGEVSLNARLIHEYEGKAELAFQISDTGIGITSEKKAKLFSAFSQIDSGNTRRYGGVGLGLSVVRQLVELMGGELEIKSEEGLGTIVNFNLELDVPEQKSATPRTYRKQEIDKELSILYAEDNPVNQKLLVMMLKGMGLDVDVAKDGKEAWQMAKDKTYHIVFMDIQMPEMDGYESTRRIIRDVPNRPVIVAVTANTTAADKEECFESGMNDFLAKPIKAEELKEAILKWQGLREFLDEQDDKDSGPKYIKLTS